MKMRKLLLAAMAALGATAAFTSCHKEEDGNYAKPIIEFRNGGGHEITEFTKEDAKVKVVVQLGDKSLKISSYEAVVRSASNELTKLKLDFKEVKGGRDDGKFEAGFNFEDTKLKDQTGYYVEVKVVPSKGENAVAQLRYNPKGGKAAGLAVKKGWVNNSAGAASGGFSLVNEKPVRFDAADADVANVSEPKKGFSAKLKSMTGMTFIKVNEDFDKLTTIEMIGVLVDKTKGKYESEISGLEPNVVFLAKDKNGLLFYLVRVDKIGAGDKDYDGSIETPTKSQNGNGGYMTFSYKTNKK